MPAYYPSNIKNDFTNKVDFVTTVFAEHVNSLQDEVTAIQVALGTSPTATSGWVGTFSTATSTWATLKARINNIEFGLKPVYDRVMATNVSNFLQTPTSANLATLVTDETGSGALVFGTSPTITPAAGTVSTATTGAGYMGMPQNPQSSSYELAASDAGKHIFISSSGTTLTIPANSSLAFPVGTTIVVVNGSGVTTSITSSDTIRLANSSSTGTRTLASNGMATLLKIASTTWIVSGNGVS